MKIRYILISGSVFLTFVMIGILYHFFGHSLIEIVYKKEISCLNWITPGRNTHSVEYFERRFDGLMRLWAGLAIVVNFLYIISDYWKLRIGIRKLMGGWIIILMVIEVSFVIFLHHPSLLKYTPSFLKHHIKNLYTNFDANCIQLEESCIRYDPSLGYRLKSGRCVFFNTEFHNEFLINSQGLRDDEDSLKAPDIIILGDSHVMGWGVNQEETFAQILEKETHLKVLNAGISSFGTVREMRLLEQLDTSSLKYLIIQYCSNDDDENKEFYKKNNKLNIMDQRSYEKTLKNYKKSQHYYPARYIILSCRIILEEILNFLNAVPQFVPPSVSVSMFLNALMSAGHSDLNRMTIIVIKIDNYVYREIPFIPELQKQIFSQDYSDFIKSLVLVDVQKDLDDLKYYYPLDGHLNAQGHRAISYDLIKTIQDLEHREKRKR